MLVDVGSTPIRHPFFTTLESRVTEYMDDHAYSEAEIKQDIDRLQRYLNLAQEAIQAKKWIQVPLQLKYAYTQSLRIQGKATSYRPMNPR